MNSNLIQIISYNSFVWVIKPLLAFGLSLLYYSTYFTIVAFEFIFTLLIKDCKMNYELLIKIRNFFNDLRPYPGVYTSPGII